MKKSCTFPPSILLVLALMGALTISVDNARAGLTFVLPDILAVADGVNPTTGTISVELDASAPDEGVTLVQGYSVAFNADAGAAVGPPQQPAAGPYSTTVFDTFDDFSTPTQNILISATAPLVDAVPATDGVILEVPFEIPAGVVSGSFALTFDQFLSTLSNEQNVNQDLSFVDGSITVIPEPSSVLLGLIGICSALACRRKRS